MVLRTLAAAMLVCAYGGALIISRLGKVLRRPRWRARGRLLVTGTFFSDNWFRSHALPLTQSGVEEVLVVADAPSVGLPGVRYLCPPWWLVRLFGRALSKFVWIIGVGVRYRPDFYIGFHILPGALSALVAARLLGRPACYQMTGGPIELIGGGANTENPLMSRLGRPSRLLEGLAIAVVREFDLIVVRGGCARGFLSAHGVNGRVAVIPGSVPLERFRGAASRKYDLVFVGRLTEMKQPLQFVEIVARLRAFVPAVRAAVVGGGPLLSEARRCAARLGVEANIDFLGGREDVEAIVTSARVFVLTSRTEGLSIAMAEAMAAGAVPVVARVGDLESLVQDGVNGYLIEPNDLQAYVRSIVRLLTDTSLWRRNSQAAVEAATRTNAPEVVAARWASCFRTVSDRCRA